MEPAENTEKRKAELSVLLSGHFLFFVNVFRSTKRILFTEIIAWPRPQPNRCADVCCDSLFDCNYLPCRSGITFIREGLLSEHDFPANPWRDDGIA